MRINNSRNPCARVASSKRLFRCAAALGTLSGSPSWAFVSPPAAARSLMHPPVSVQGASVSTYLNGRDDRVGLLQCKSPLTNVGVRSVNNLPTQRLIRSHQPNTRLFFSGANNNNNDDDWGTLKKAAGNLARKAGDKIKSIIPFGKSEEEKRSKIIKQERKAELTGGLSTLLKDAPLPIRMVGRMVAPLLSNMAEEIAEQSRQAEDILEDARVRLANDANLVQKLGEPLQIGRPFSQSSSTTIINGKSSARVQASFQVVGPNGSGIANMEASDGNIRSLAVNVNGVNMSVGLGGSVYGRSSSGSKKVDNIIEAEIIEKK